MYVYWNVRGFQFISLKLPEAQWAQAEPILLFRSHVIWGFSLIFGMAILKRRLWASLRIISTRPAAADGLAPSDSSAPVQHKPPLGRAVWEGGGRGVNPPS